MTMSNIAISDSYDDPFILLCDEKISEFGRLVPILEGFAQSKKSLVIICRELTGSALTTLVLNVRENGLKAAAIAVPEVGERVYEVLEDIAAFTSATVVSQHLGQCLQSLRPEMLGKADRVEVSSNNCVLIRETPDCRMVEARKQMIRQELQRERYLSYDREKLQIRLARLSGGIAELRVGAHSQQQQKQQILRYRKAVHALQSARRSGVLPGAGSVYAHVASRLDSYAPSKADKFAFGVLSSALRQPLCQLATSVGFEFTSKLGNGGSVNESRPAQVFDVCERRFTDTGKADIYDSTEIVIASVKRAVSIARTLLKSDVSIVKR